MLDILYCYKEFSYLYCPSIFYTLLLLKVIGLHILSILVMQDKDHLIYLRVE